MLIEEPRRCSWCNGDAFYQLYHDQEWGVPIFDPIALFEKLALESMQAGLAWITVLKKREQMKAQFYGFDPFKLARCSERHVQAWLQDPGLIRHQGKLEALVRNAQLTIAEEEFSDLLWQFAPEVRLRNRRGKQLASQTAESQAMARMLKNRGFGFVGPTTCYSFMQSVGMVNDHAEDCWRYEVLSNHHDRADFDR